MVKLIRHLNPRFLHQGVLMSEAVHMILMSQGENEKIDQRCQGLSVTKGIQGEIGGLRMERERELTESVLRVAGLTSGRRLSTLTSLASLERFDRSTSFEAQSLFPFAILHPQMKLSQPHLLTSTETGFMSTLQRVTFTKTLQREEIVSLLPPFTHLPRFTMHRWITLPLHPLRLMEPMAMLLTPMILMLRIAMHLVIGGMREGPMIGGMRRSVTLPLAHTIAMTPMTMGGSVVTKP